MEPAERQGQAERLALRVRPAASAATVLSGRGLRPMVVAVAPEVRFQPLSPAAVVVRDVVAQAAQAPLPAEPEGFRPQRPTGLVGKASRARQQSRRPRTQIGAGLAVRALPRRRWLHLWGAHPSVAAAVVAQVARTRPPRPSLPEVLAEGLAPTRRAAAGLSERTALPPPPARLARLPTQVAADTAVVVAERPSRPRLLARLAAPAELVAAAVAAAAQA